MKRKKIYVTDQVESYLVNTAKITGISQSQVVLLLLEHCMRDEHVISRLLRVIASDDLQKNKETALRRSKW